MKNKFPHFSIHALTVIPSAPESQNFPIIFFELFETVEIVGCSVYLDLLLFDPLGNVGIDRTRFSRIKNNSLTSQVLSCPTITVVDFERFTIKRNFNAKVEIFPD